MAAIKGSHANVADYTALQAESPEPSAPPEPEHNPKIDPNLAEVLMNMY